MAASMICSTPIGGSGHGRQEHRRTHDRKPDRSNCSNTRFMSQRDTGKTGVDTPDNDNHGEADSDGEGRLVSVRWSITTKDLREFLLPEDQAAAERAARRIARPPTLPKIEAAKRRW